MDTRPARPISVWIAQILIMLFSIMFGMPIVMLVPMLVTRPGSFSIFGLILALTIYLSIIILLQFAFWGMVRRRSYGRWIGVSLLFLIVAFSIIGQFARPSGPFEYYEYDNVRQAAAGFITQLVIIALLLWLAFTLALGKKVKTFFSPLEESEDSSDLIQHLNPPDPPRWNG